MENPLYRLCQVVEETLQHILCECERSVMGTMGLFMVRSGGCRVISPIGAFWAGHIWASLCLSNNGTIFCLVVGVALRFFQFTALRSRIHDHDNIMVLLQIAKIDALADL